MSKLLLGTLGVVATATLVFILSLRSVPVLPFSAAGLSALPLAVSISSFCILVVRASLRNSSPEGPIQSVSTASYLASGPSAAAAFVMQFATAAPSTSFWMAGSATLLFFGSAFFYYFGLEHSEDERHRKIPVRPFSNV
ncbi:MAG: hypothetical protein OK404_03035 [Thaumarchaeota archaeon]|nr:hypothetical protein [Nitrososphaerota archaeon]